MATNQIAELEMSDGSNIHQGDKRKITATVTDASDVAATPTQFKLKFTPPSGSSNATTYSKTPGTGEVAFTSETSNTFTAEHEFDESGWWKVVGAGSGNMAEVEPVRIYVVPVTDAP